MFINNLSKAKVLRTFWDEVVLTVAPLVLFGLRLVALMLWLVAPLGLLQITLSPSGSVYRTGFALAFYLLPTGGAIVFTALSFATRRLLDRTKFRSLVGHQF